MLEVQLSNLTELETPPTSYGITDESFEAICAVGYEAPHPGTLAPSAHRTALGPHATAVALPPAAVGLASPSPAGAELPLSTCGCPPLAGADDLAALSVSELKQLVHARRLDDFGCIEKVHLIELLSKNAPAKSAQTVEDAAPADSGASTALAQPPFDPERRKNLPPQCAICMADFRDDEQLKVLPCSDLHAFHTDCIQQWLDKHTSCPLCRTECGERRPPPETVGMPSLLPLEELLTGLSQHAMIAQLPGPDGNAFLLIDSTIDGRGGGGGSLFFGGFGGSPFAAGGGALRA